MVGELLESGADPNLQGPDCFLNEAILLKKIADPNG